MTRRKGPVDHVKSGKKKKNQSRGREFRERELTKKNLRTNLPNKPNSGEKEIIFKKKNSGDGIDSNRTRLHRRPRRKGEKGAK